MPLARNNLARGIKVYAGIEGLLCLRERGMSRPFTILGAAFKLCPLEMLNLVVNKKAAVKLVKAAFVIARVVPVTNAALGCGKSKVNGRASVLRHCILAQTSRLQPASAAVIPVKATSSLLDQSVTDKSVMA